MPRATKWAWPADGDLINEIVAAGGPTRYARGRGMSPGTLMSRVDKRGLRETLNGALNAALPLEDAVTAALNAARGAEARVSSGPKGPERARTEVRGDTATVVTPASPELGDMDALMRERGLEPDDWEVKDAVVSSWDAMTGSERGNELVTMRQLKLYLRRRTPIHWIYPAVDIAPVPMPRIERDPERPLQIAYIPDQHLPYINREVEKRVFELLYDVQPDRIVNLGDVCDYPTISRHKDNPAYFASVKECNQTGFEHIYTQRQICPNSVIDLIEGNHDARPRTELLGRAERMYGITPAQWPGEETEEELLSIRRMLHLDRLHVNFVGPPLAGDSYMHGHLEITEDLAACHGWLTGTSSAAGTMERLGMSVVFGHTHHQRVHEKLRYKGARPVARMFGIEAGTLRGVPGGGGFAKNPDWHHGLVTTTVWPDGRFSYDMARVELDGRLYWRDRRY